MANFAVSYDMYNQLYNSVISAALVYGLDESTQKALLVHDEGVSCWSIYYLCWHIECVCI